MADERLLGLISLAIFIGQAVMALILFILVAIFIGMQKRVIDKPVIRQPSFGYLIGSLFCIVIGLAGIGIVENIHDPAALRNWDFFISPAVFVVSLGLYFFIGYFWKTHRKRDVLLENRQG